MSKNQLIGHIDLDSSPAPTPTNAATQITSKSPSSDSSAYGSIAKDRAAIGTSLTPNYHISVNNTAPKTTNPLTVRGGYGAEKLSQGIGGKVNTDGTASTVSNKTNVGKLIGGTVVQGADRLAKGLTSTADMLLGGAAQEVHNILNQTADTLGYSGEGNLFGDKNIISRFNDYVHNYSKANEEYYAKNAEGSKVAQAVNTYGTQVMAAVPAALLAVMTAGTSLGATATTESLATAAAIGESSGAAQFANIAGNAIKQIAANPNTQLSFAQEAGNAYESALADGATESEAAVYASIYGILASAVEVGGADDALGGIQKLPIKVQEAFAKGNKKAVLEYAKSIVSEMGEEVVQGMLERGMKSMYSNVPIYSNTDQNALINPSVMGEEAKSAAIVSSILGGGQIAAGKIINGKSKTSTDVKANETINSVDANNIKAEIPQNPALAITQNKASQADLQNTPTNDTTANAKADTEQSRQFTEKPVETSTADTHKQQQNDIIQQTNPADDSLGYHTWIRSADDIRTFDEAWAEDPETTPDFTEAQATKAMETGEVTVYSKDPIENGIWITPSLMEAKAYAGNGKIYSETVKLSDVAWVDTLQGQYAKTDSVNNPALNITQPKAQTTTEEDTFSMMRPPVNEDIVSTEKKAQSHSIEGVANARGFKYEGHTYMTRPEVESLNMAAKRVSKDMPGEISRLGNKDAWTGVDVDTAMTIANGLFDDIAKTGDSKAFDSWMKVLENHKTASGQSLQAYAKWVRSPLGRLELIKKKAAYISSQTTTKKDPKGVKAGAASQVATDITNAVNDIKLQVAEEISAMADELGNVGIAANDDIASLTEKNARYTESVKDANGNPVTQNGTISEYSQTIAEDLARTIDKKVSGVLNARPKPEQTIRQKMVASLMKFVNEKLPKKQKAANKVTATDILTDYINNQELFQEAWNTAQETLKQYYTNMGNEAALDYLNSFTNEGINAGADHKSVFMKAIAETAVNTGETNSVIKKQAALGYSSAQIAEQIANDLSDITGGNLAPGVFIEAATNHVNNILNSAETDYDATGLVRSAMKDISTDLSTLAKSDADTRSDVYDKIADTLITKYGLTGADAANVVNTIQTMMSDLVSERADSILQNKYGAKPTEKAKATFKEKLTEAVNLGAFDSQFAEQATKSLFGIEGITIDQNLIDEYAMQTTDEGRDAVIDKMKQNIADQTPSTLMDKFTSLRYMNMLGNIKTLKNNLIGNAIGFSQRKAKDAIKSVIEAGTSLASGGKTERTAAILHGGKRYNAALQDYRNSTDVQETLASNKKYGDSSWDSTPSDIDSLRTIWKFGDNPVTRALGIANKQTVVHKGLEAWGNAIDSAMNGMILGDAFWSSRNYADSLAGWMKANNITPAQWQSMVENGDKRVDAAREYAIGQAKEATFRDRNAVSEFASNFDKNWNKDGNAVGTAAKVVTKGIAPFRATPANVLVRMEEYSPLGLANTLVDGVKAAKGTGDGNQFIESLAKTMTGTGLLALGYAAAKAGLARTKDNDDKLEQLNNLEGNQDYSIKIGDTTFSLDQFSPANVEFFLGVELNKLTADGEITGDEITQFISTITDTIIQSSMLKGVNDAIQVSQSYDSGDTNAITQVVLNAALSYLTQGLSPTLAKQIRQFSNENRQTNVTDPDSVVPTVIQKGINKAFGTNSVDYIDAWGNKQKNGDNLGERGFNAFLGSTYPSQIDDKTKAVNDVLKEIYTNTKGTDGYVNIIPSVPSRNTEINGTKLSNEEYETYATTLGQTKFGLYEKAINADGFKDLPYEEQAKILGDLSSYAKGIAEKSITDSRGEAHDSDTDKLLYGTDGKATVSVKNLTDYIMAKDTFSYANSDGVKDYNLIADTVSNYENLPKEVQTALMERDSGYKKAYEYAYGRNVTGKSGDRQGVGIENLGTFMQKMDTFNDAENSSDYAAIDNLIKTVGDDKIGTALKAWNSSIKEYARYAQGGIGSELLNKSKESVGDVQDAEDTDSDNSRIKYKAILNMDASDADKKKLFEFSYTDDDGKTKGYLSKNWQRVYDILSKYGANAQQIYDFAVDADASAVKNEETGKYDENNKKANNVFSAYEIATELNRTNLPYATKVAIFNDFAAATGTAGRYDTGWSKDTGRNKWRKYTFREASSYPSSYTQGKYNMALSIGNEPDASGASTADKKQLTGHLDDSALAMLFPDLFS